MKTIRFNYEVYFGRKELFPFCYIHLLGKRGKVCLKALTDSGATYSVFPESAAEDAGLDLSDSFKEFILYGSGKVRAKRQTSYILLQDTRLKIDVFYVEKLEFPFVLLGRASFFNKFEEIAFMEKRKAPRTEFRYR